MAADVRSRRVVSSHRPSSARADHSARPCGSGRALSRAMRDASLTPCVESVTIAEIRKFIARLLEERTRLRRARSVRPKSHRPKAIPCRFSMHGRPRGRVIHRSSRCSPSGHDGPSAIVVCSDGSAPGSRRASALASLRIRAAHPHRSSVTDAFFSDRSRVVLATLRLVQAPLAGARRRALLVPVRAGVRRDGLGASALSLTEERRRWRTGRDGEEARQEGRRRVAADRCFQPLCRMALLRLQQSRCRGGRGGRRGVRTLWPSSPAVGSIVSTLPDDCVTTVVNGCVYRQCGSVWYQPQYTGSDVTYVVVHAP